MFVGPCGRTAVLRGTAAVSVICASQGSGRGLSPVRALGKSGRQGYPDAW